MRERVEQRGETISDRPRGSDLVLGPEGREGGDTF